MGMVLWEGFAILLLASAWFYLAFGHGGFWKALPRLEMESEPLPQWPEVTVIVPARDEAETLSRTLPALLGQDYPGTARVVLVDDHSADGTGSLARRIAAESGSKIGCRILDAAPLEPGWTGKLWALEQGLRSAGFRAESAAPGPRYYLFTDADILHSTQALRALVRKAETEDLALVSVMAKLRCDSFWEKLLIPAFVFFFQKLYPFSRVGDPRSRTAGAAGGCLLVRSEALARIGGIASIRSELIDDCALARRIKRSGGRIWLGLSDSVRSLRAYGTLGPLWNMVARTAFTQLKRSWILLGAAVAGMVCLYILPLVFFAGGIADGNVAAAMGGGALWFSMSLLYWPMVRFYGLPFFYAFSLPAVAVLYCGMTADSAWQHWRGSAAPWKGRSYGA